MSYKTTRRADQDIIDLYVSGAVKFGVDQEERYHEWLIAKPCFLRSELIFRAPR